MNTALTVNKNLNVLTVEDILSVIKSEDLTAAELLEQVFPHEGLQSEASAAAAEKAVTISNLVDHLELWMEETARDAHTQGIT
ncbi:hypothetical protein DPMN_121139 [Dreissena polymorpha]|uniref:Uncharacterized protein n=1 Tax=Dreissena polymorpha TaxID=45954 RepID=A0A9D4GL58_DREPO|nr:hypothetical protein DPMN_121139 [Dreissena polymorpha]